MLMCCHVCIKCTGRLQQLFDFNILKTHLEVQGDRSISDAERCSFCGTNDIMTGLLEERAQAAVSQTKWRQVSLVIKRLANLSKRIYF